MKQPSNPEALWPAILAMVLLVFIWTANLLVSRYSVLEGLSSYDLAALRYSIAGLILLPNFFRIGGLKDLGGLGWKKGLILSFLAGPPYMIPFFYGFKLAPVSHAAVLAPGIVPSVVFLGLVLTGRTSFSLAAVCSLILIVIGLTFVTAVSFSTHQDVLMGDALFVVGGLFWGLFTFLSRIWKVSPMPSVTVISVLSLTYIPFYFAFFYEGINENISITHVVLQGIFQGLFNWIMAVALMLYALQKLGAQNTALFSPIVPLTAALMAIPFLGEIPTAMQWLGIIMVSLGILATSRLTSSTH